ncbi:MAG: DUF4262 domain-containing protein [Planctomycetes bacterium]|nr:DUF4262 domain-containing protein [Planctomycetota bacterium]
MNRPEPQDDAERQLLADVEEYGCHVVLIDDGDGWAPFGYSVGIQHTCKAPEVVVYGLEDELTHWIVNEYHDRVKNGERFEPGQRYEGFLEGHEVEFVPVQRDYHQDYFGATCWFTGSDDFEVLQLVWPTTDGKYPCDDDAPDDFRGWQRALYACECEPGHHPDLVAEGGPDAPLEQQRTIVCSHVFDAKEPARFVCRDDDGDWQVLCGADHGDDDVESARMVPFGHVLEGDPTLREVADLEIGEQAERDQPGQPWRRGERDD